ncbi:hypothetical protein [Pontibacter liquoris]|uniref:hypothetical protein n=1 Tax=Pontibacter liquoris TaxID=2905677 RepID=UPI001FA77C1F|nr:hypothetical protein [Pontibacter liquoris]
MIQSPEEVRQAISQCFELVISECRLILASELHYQAMLYHHLRQTGGIPFNQLGMNVKTTIPGVQHPFLHQKSLSRHADYQNADIEIIPDITVFTRDIDHDWRRRNFISTLKETLYSLEVKASERHKGRLQQKEIETDIRKLVAQREETERIHNRRIGVGMFIIDVAPDPDERMKGATLNYLTEFARQQEVDIWYFNQETQVETSAKPTPVTS